MLANIGSTELIIVAVIIFLFFGSKKLRELAHGLGESTKEVKKIGKELSSSEDKKTKNTEQEEVEDL